MDDLLREAIADAKAVRETALANAKIALEEAFTPRLQSMLSRKIEAEMGEEQQTITRKTRGNNRKTGLKIASFVNLVMADSKVKRSKIIKVLENQTNNDYQRRGIITKGAIVETEDGKCRIVSRPGQSGTVSGILVK